MLNTEAERISTNLKIEAERRRENWISKYFRHTFPPSQQFVRRNQLWKITTQKNLWCENFIEQRCSPTSLTFTIQLPICMRNMTRAHSNSLFLVLPSISHRHSLLYICVECILWIVATVIHTETDTRATPHEWRIHLTVVAILSISCMCGLRMSNMQFFSTDVFSTCITASFVMKLNDESKLQITFTFIEKWKTKIGPVIWWAFWFVFSDERIQKSSRKTPIWYHSLELDSMAIL